MMKIPTSKEQVFNGILEVLTTRTGPMMHFPYERLTMVEEVMVENMPKANLVSMERSQAPNFLLESDPSSRKEIDPPSMI